MPDNPNIIKGIRALLMARNSERLTLIQMRECDDAIEALREELRL